MIFSQIEYFYFFGLVLALHFAVPRRRRIWVLLTASLVFYGTWNYQYLALILGSTFVDHIAAWRVYRSDVARTRNRWLLASLVANLGSLAVFKYLDFFIGSVDGLLGAVGIDAHLPTLHLLLPVGISFYTFQSMSYTIDVWRRERAPEPSVIHFATYVAFFPQLVAGPIVRAGDLIDQLKDPPPATVSKFKRGSKLFLWGLLKKNLFADLVAIKSVDVVFSNPSAFDTPSLWLAALAYSLQIYADFSGYTDMARGSALLMGYELPENFRTPYLSRSITEFWQRWHISLSSWLRDYLYIALGGNRGGTWKTYRNLMLTMLLGGLWHGAAWTFVVWGALHGAALGLHRWWSRRTAKDARWIARRRSPLYSMTAGALTFVFVCLCFVLFRADTFDSAATMIWHLFAYQDGLRALHIAPVFLVALFALGTLVGARLDLPKLYARIPWPLRSVGYAGVVLLLLLLTPSSAVPFVYFQF